MKTIGKVLPGILGGVGGLLVGKLFKKPKAPASQRAAQRDDVADRINQDDERLKRRGSLADILTGDSGAEAAPASAKQLLGA